MSDKVIIFDTTLRDGEQSPGISLDPGEKLEIAEQLARLGVDYIEAGFPVSSQGEFEAVQAIARTVQGPVIAGLSRTQLADVDRCYEALRDAERSRIHIFISTSPSHMEHMLKMSEDQVLEAVRMGVSRAREHCGRHRVLTPGRDPHTARLHARGACRRGRVRGYHLEHPRHRRLRHSLGLRRSHRARTRPGRRRVRGLDPLPRRPRPRRGQQPVRGAREVPARSRSASTASASAPGTPRSRRWSWRSRSARISSPGLRRT